MEKPTSFTTKLFLFLFVATLAYVTFAAHGAAARRLKVEDLNAPSGVTGHLGHPLGKIVTIEAEVFEGKPHEAKALEGVKQLRVTKVNGVKSASPQSLRFAWLMSANATILQGKVKVIGYETGEFGGIPHEAFQHVMPVASEGFGFQSSFVVLKAL